MAVVKTDISFETPEGYEFQVRPRSGLALKHGIFVVNSPGTIDSDYRGEVRVILGNFGTNNYTIQEGDRIGQIILSKVEKVEWIEVRELTETERGSNGYGSTG